MSQLYLSAAHKSSGKTTVTLGLCAALRARDLAVQPFKKGPDYIDPIWLSQAAGRECYNLDFFTTPADEIQSSYRSQSAGADVVLVEGNKGLYDGLDLNGSDSNAAMARLLNLPVVLVINTLGITRGVAPLLLGYQAFHGAPEIAGVILNNIAGQRHEQKLIAVVETYTDIPVIGAVRRNSRMNIDERHLGLVPGNEQQGSAQIIAAIASQVTEQVELDRLLELGRQPAAGDAVEKAAPVSSSAVSDTAVRIGIFQDAAFGFYYPDDLAVLRQLGAQLVPINALQDAQLPAVDALFIGGGFPETHMQALADNQSLLKDVREFIDSDGVVYAECGGLMYLARSLTWQEKSVKLCGVIPGDVVMHQKPQGRGYIKLRETGKMTWLGGDASQVIAAHEFHYSSLENMPADADYAYEVVRGQGIDGKHDGYLYRNLLANYAHMRNVGSNRWAERFVARIKAVKERKAHANEVE